MNTLKQFSLLLLLTAGFLMAAGTPAGTEITNVAYGDYDDANGNAMPQVQSNAVTTIVSQIAGVDIIPDQTASNMSPQGSHAYPMDVINTGNGTDSFDLSELSTVIGTGSYEIEIYVDIDGNGIIDGLDSLITETGPLAADDFLDIIVLVTDITPGGAPDGDVVSTDVTAVSQFDGTVSDSSTLTTTIAGSVMDITISNDNPSPIPGDVVTFTVCAENIGSAPAYETTLLTSGIPDGMTYVAGSMGYSTSSDPGSALPLTDPDDGVEYPPSTQGDFGISSPNSVTINLGQMNPSDYYCVFFQVTIDEGVPEGSDIPIDIVVETENDEGDPYPPEEYQGGTVTVDQLFDVSAGDDLTTVGDPGDQILYPVCFTNDGNGTDVFNITYVSNFWTWTFYWDFNGNGVIDADDVLLTDTNNDGIPDLGELDAGDTACIIAAATVPAGTNDGTVEQALITATSVGDPAISDSGTVTVTVTAPYLILSKSVTPTGPQPPGTVLTYRVDLLNAGTGMATNVLVTDAVPDNATYQAGTLTIAGVSKTDASDGDTASFANGTASFTIPSIGPSGTTFVTFQVMID